MKKAKNVAIHIAKGLLASFLFGTLILVSLYAFVKSDRGGVFVATQVGRIADKFIVGTLRVGRVEVESLTDVRVHDLVLSTAEGQSVFELERLRVTVDSEELKKDRIAINTLEISKPTVRLVRDNSGELLLKKALTATRPKESEASTELSPFAIRSLAIDEGRVFFENGDGDVKRITFAISGALVSLHNAIDYHLKGSVADARISSFGKLALSQGSFSDLSVALSGLALQKFKSDLDELHLSTKVRVTGSLFKERHYRAAVESLSLTGPKAEGKASGVVRIQGEHVVPDFELDARSTQRIPWRISARLQNRRADIAFATRLKNRDDVKVITMINFEDTLTRFEVMPSTITFAGDEWRTQGTSVITRTPVTVRNFRAKTRSGAEIKLDARVVNKSDIKAKLEFAAFPLLKLFNAKHVKDVVATGIVRFRGNVAEPTVFADVVMLDKRERFPVSLFVNGQFEKNLLTLDGRLQSNIPDTTLNLKLNAKLPFVKGAKTFSPKFNELLATLKAEASDLSKLKTLVPGAHTLEGSLRAEAQIFPASQREKNRGHVEASAVSIGIDSFRPVRDLSARLELAQDSLYIRHLNFSTGGRVEVAGEVQKAFSTSPQARFDVAIKRLVLDANKNPDLRLDARFRVEALQTKAPELVNTESTVTLHEARLWLPGLPKGSKAQSLRRDPSIKLVPAPKTTAKKPHTSERNSKWKVTIVGPKQLFLQGPDTLVELGTNLVVASGTPSATLDGSVYVVRSGTLTLVGRKFEMERGEVSFAKNRLRQGRLDVEATYLAKTAMVYINLIGTLEKPDFELRSDPPMSESQIVAAILGFDPDQNASNPDKSVSNRSATLAANVLASIVATQIESSMFHGAPLTLGIHIEDAEQKRGSVEIGKYVSPDLFVSFDKNFGTEVNENINEFQFDYTLTRKWSLEGYYGDAGEGGLDVMWRRRF